MENSMPAGAIPADQFEAASSGEQGMQAAAPPGAIPADQFESHEDYYSSPGQQVKAGLEGAAQGVAGPLATLAETKLLKVKPQDILGREEENPITHGIGEAAGLVGGALTGTGEAAVLGKVGEAAVGAANIGKATLGAKIGSSAVQQAAEMAVLQAGDETSKMILHDPNTTAQTAIANVGLSAALGGAGGAFITGAVSPLWEATAGPKVEAFFNALKSHMNGTSVMPEAIAKSAQDLGITPEPVLRAAMSGDPKIVMTFNELREAQHPQIMQSIDKLHKDASDSVMSSLNIKPEDIHVYSENEAGHDLLDAFKREYDEKYEPLAKALQKRDEEAAHISIPDEARLNQYGKMVEKGMAEQSANSPYFKLYEEYGNRLLDTDTIGKIDKLKTEINNRLRGMSGPGTDYNVKQVLSDIKSQLTDFQENHIAKSALEAVGPEGKQLGKGLLDERATVNKGYASFANMSDELTNHLGIGDFRGAGTLKGKLTDKIAPEQLLNKFSIRNNADFIPFLQRNFPETFDAVKQNELKRFLRPAVLSAKGETDVNISKLSDIVEKGMSGKKDYVDAILPPGALQKIQAAKTLTEAIPGIKSSGTAGWVQKLSRHVPANALAATSFIMGHNPVSGYLTGGLAQILSKNVPEAAKLTYLKFLAADKPVESKAIKAAYDYIEATYKGENLLSKATKNVFKSGAQVLTASQRPSQANRDKLDKLVSEITDKPDKMAQLQNGHVGHYFPDHQTALTQTSTQAAQYLQQLKPRPYKPSALDGEIKPLPAQEARYNRALDIAQQPAIVLEHIKNGTLQTSDIADLNAMYPSLYTNLTQKITNELGNKQAAESAIPYKTRMSASLFLGHPLDSTMTPASIISAQPVPKPIPANQGGAQGKTRKGTSTLGKSNKNYMTASQSAESDRVDRD